MALANRRPVPFPVNDSTPSSPAYKPRRLSLNANYSLSSTLKNKDHKEVESADEKESTPEKSSSPEEFKDASPTSTVSSTTSSGISNGGSKKEKPAKIKSEKKYKTQSSRTPIATGISTTIPVTGERPKPEKHSSLDDDVLYAIFEILFERDEEGKGMTVKQICDILVEKHPEMAKLSTKTSNLVSAKLNAYVKRVEKGEKSLIYAMSREWADASPKRMVYVYRGLLAPDYYIHALAAIESQKGSTDDGTGHGENRNHMSDGISNDFSGNDMDMKRRATAFELGIIKQTFADQLNINLPQLSIPYSAAPVTACLGLGDTLKKSSSNLTHASSRSLDNDDDLDELDQFDEFDHVTFKANKRSKSMSYLTSKKLRPLTVAAAAPRFSKVSVTPSPSAAAAAAALHAATLEGVSPAGSVALGFDSRKCSASSEPPVAAKWLEAVRDGFLTQDIETPEDTSLAELDSLFA